MLGISYKMRQGVRVLGQSVGWGRGRGGMAWLNLNHQGASAGLAFWWASCSHSSNHLHWNATTGRGEGRTVGRWASVLVRVGREWKAKAYLNTKEMRSVSRGPCPCSPIRAAILCFPPSMLWGSILNTKALSTLFDQYMHFHHSALFCLYNQAGDYKEVVIHPSVRFNSTLLLLLMLLFVLCLLLILWVIAFRQMIYLSESFINAYLWSLYGLLSFKFLFLAHCNRGHIVLLAGRRSLFCNSLGASDTNYSSDKWGQCVIFLSSSSFLG